MNLGTPKPFNGSSPLLCAGLLLGLLIFSPELSHAEDLIVFKSGRTVNCTIVNETEGRVVYLVKGRKRVAARKAIARIERTEALAVDVNGRIEGKASDRETNGTKVAENRGGNKEDGGKGNEGKKEEETDDDGGPYHDGWAKGLVAHYFKDHDHWKGLWQEGAAAQAPAKDWTFTKYKFTTIEPHVNHVFIRRGWFTVRWVGTLVVGKNGEKAGGNSGNDGIDPEINFEFHADDGAKLTIDGKVLIDSWQPCSEETEESHRKASTMLRPGKHSIVIEYFQGESLQHHDNDPAKLYWSSKDLRIPRQLIPAGHFLHQKSDMTPKPGREDGDSVELNFVRGDRDHNNEDHENRSKNEK